MAQKNGTLTAAVKQLNERVAELERQLAELKQQTAKPPEKDWRRTVGMFPGHEGLKEIDRLGAEYREKQRRPAKRAKAGNAKAKS